jgi:cation transport ATPase
MLEEGSKPRPPDSRRDAVPESATRTAASWAKNPWIGVIGALLGFLVLAGLVLAAAYPGQDFGPEGLNLWPELQRHYWLVAAVSVLVCLGFGKRVQTDAVTDILNVRVSGRFLLALGADAGLVAGLMLGINRDDLWHLESGLAAMVLANGIVAGAVLGRRLLAGPTRKPHAPPSPPVTAVQVEPGAFIPFDGFVIAGRSEVDDGLVGGSPLGSLRGAGDTVHRGARNGDGRLTIDPLVEAPATAPSFMAAPLFPRMIHAKALLIFIGLVVLAVVLASMGTTLPAARLALGLLVLAVATPAALGLVRPMIHAKVVARARKLGWALNGTAVIDALSDISALACGRGGVVTKAEMEIVAIHPAIDVEAVELVAAAATIAQSSHGVWARALLRYAVRRKLRLAPLAEWTDEIVETGFGIRALTQGGQGLIAGTRDWVAEQGIRTSLLEAQERDSLTAGRRALWVAQVTPAPVLIGVIIGGERLKPGASEMCKNAKRFGLTGALLDRRGAEGSGELARYLGLRFVEDDTLARKAMATEWSTLGLKPVIVQHRGDPVPDAPVGPRLLMGMHATGDAAPAVAGDWAAATAREDPRLVMDLLRLCHETKRREKFGYLLATVFTVPGLWLIATGQTSAAILVLAALIGMLGVIANAQLLGFVTSTATEIDEEE